MKSFFVTSIKKKKRKRKRKSKVVELVKHIMKMGYCIIDETDTDSCDEEYCTSCCSCCTTATTKSSIEKTTLPSQAAPQTSLQPSDDLKYNNAYEKISNDIKNCSYNEPNTEASNGDAMRGPPKDLIGNNKQFRIENNKCDLRIIGNNNSIRIGINMGNLQIVGNNSRLKIINNSGQIKYTGNNGRICLGCESTQQVVDYIGCTGILKICNTMELKKSHERCKSNRAAAKAKATTTATAPSAATTTTTTTATTFNNGVNQLNSTNCKNIYLANNVNCTKPPTTMNSSSTSASATGKPPKVKVKSASYGGDTKTMPHWQKFNEMFQNQKWQKFVNVSLPNLKEKSTNDKHKNINLNNAKECNCKCNGKCKANTKTYSNNKKKSNCSNQHMNISSNVNVVSNVGNIHITNSVNINI